MKAEHVSANAVRRVALCARALIAGALAGALLVPLVSVRGVFAAPSRCAVFCGKTAGTSGPAHASCIQACRKCKGDVSRVCEGPVGSLCCASAGSCCPGPTGATCCAAGDICFDGQCITPRAFCIPTCGDTCSGGTGCLQPCDNTIDCFCVSTTEGAAACILPICTDVECTSSAECGPGAVCFNQGCCGP